MIRSAPSFPLQLPFKHRAASTVAADVLARLGDRRYVRRVVLGQVPVHKRRNPKGYFAGVEPPPDARWGYISVRGHSMLGSWEAALVAGALRDDLCANGGPPLVAWTAGRSGGAYSDNAFPFEQRFPNPTAASFRRQVSIVGRRYSFRVLTLRLLHPSQLAPLLVVTTTVDRRAFIGDVSLILEALDPHNDQAATFEGFYFEARDKKGAFVRTESINRGHIEGGQWTGVPNDFPFASG